MNEEPSIIHFANVTKRFKDVTAVNDISLRINKGEIVGFVGPNGAGKTTTLSLLMGFIRPTSGEATLFGKYSTKPEVAHKAHRLVGFVAGDMELPDNLTGRQYLAFMASRFGTDDEVVSHLKDLLKPQLKPKIKHLSRGNKQKIALIGALQHKPQLLLLDEPTSGLDPLMQQTFLDIISREAERGATILLSSHILSEVAHNCSRIIFMKQGRVISDRSTEEITAEAGKYIRITCHERVMKDIMRTLPQGCKLRKQSPTQVSMLYGGDMKKFLRWVSVRDIEDVEIENRDLDDIFRDLYKDKREEK